MVLPESRAGTHRYKLTIDDGSLYLAVECEYDAADETRPCWPHEEDGTPMAGKDATDCTYVDWSENLSTDEILHGMLEIYVDCEPDWSDGAGLELNLLRVSDADSLQEGTHGPPTFRVDLNMLRGHQITAALASGDASVALRPSSVYVGAPVIVLDDEDTIADATVIAIRGGVIDLEINWATWRDRFAAERPTWNWQRPRMVLPESRGENESEIATDGEHAIAEALKQFGWTCGPEFWQRYHNDAWVFNLANAVERLSSALLKAREKARADSLQEGTP